MKRNLVTAEQIALTPPRTHRDTKLAAFAIEERKWLISRLEAIVRNPDATDEELRVAKDMLAHYRDKDV